MVASTTKLNRNEDLIELLSYTESRTRMQALHLLCEGYATSPEILRQVFQGWDRWGAAEAYTEFAMLSHIPIAEECLSEVFDRAEKMAEGRKLVDPSARCAGKLVEQAMLLPTRSLAPHVDRLQQLKALSKIFFRVDLEHLGERVLLLDRTADQLAAVLDDSMARLVEDASDGGAMQRGLAALDALRREHPDYLELSSVFKSRASVLEDSAPSPSFLVTLRSLTQWEHPGLESHLAVHLSEEQESVYTSAVEALVRAGSHEAAQGLTGALLSAPPENQKWIARGLQRFRIVGLSPTIAELREQTQDARIWLMLLIAEIRQFEPESCDRIAESVERVQSASETLVDSLGIYIRLNDGTAAGRKVALALTDYVQRISKSQGSSS